MLGRGHKRSRSHFSEFTFAPPSPKPVGGDRKQQSEEPQTAKIETLRSLGHKKSFSTTSLITIAGAVVTSDTLNNYPDLPSSSSAMARPRSPQKKHDAEYEKMELMLDKKLLAIREQLVSICTAKYYSTVLMSESVYIAVILYKLSLYYSTGLCKLLVQWLLVIGVDLDK